MHDETVERTTNGTGGISDLSLEELQALDAGYHFTRDGGQTFPYRGQGVQIPTLREGLEAAPKHRFLVELKAPASVVPQFLKEIESCGATGRVLIASFNPAVMEAVRSQSPGILVCYDRDNGAALLSALRGGGWEAYQPVAPVLSVPAEMQAQFKITPEEIARIQQKGILYQSHTLNTRSDIEQALDAGVKSILSDDPILLDKILRERGKPPVAPGTPRKE